MIKNMNNFYAKLEARRTKREIVRDEERRAFSNWFSAALAQHGAHVFLIG